MAVAVSNSNDDNVILEDYGRKVSLKTNIFFSVLALIVSATPIFLYLSIHRVNLQDYAIIFSIGTLVSTFLVSYAYRNTKFLIKHDIAQQREDAVRKEMNALLANDKKMSRKEKDERILWKKNEVADFESTNYSIFINNLLFLVIFLIASFVLLKNFAPSYNYLFSITVASGVVGLLSSGSKSAI